MVPGKMATRITVSNGPGMILQNGTLLTFVGESLFRVNLRPRTHSNQGKDPKYAPSTWLQGLLEHTVLVLGATTLLDPTVGLCLGTYGDSKGVGVFL